MRINEISSTVVNEIDRQELSGNYLTRAMLNPRYASGRSALKKLPGENSYAYTVGKTRHDTALIVLVDTANNKKNIGALEISSSDAAKFPIQPAYRVVGIAVDQQYRGRGIAKSLYGIALTLPPLRGCVLLADTIQTSGGRLNWASISKIPGCAISGWIRIPWFPLDSHERRVSTTIKKNGLEAIGKSGLHDYYSYPVTIASNKIELQSAVKSSILQVYDNQNLSTDDIGLYARWSGA